MDPIRVPKGVPIYRPSDGVPMWGVPFFLIMGKKNGEEPFMMPATLECLADEHIFYKHCKVLTREGQAVYPRYFPDLVTYGWTPMLPDTKRYKMIHL